ncbi:TIGR02587 family membrane protein [Leptolyngbya sp. FACHB-261]|uniref:TIGR02587 family membrane protein n=1 Tax=Leptolyngbya sp. FACHB-261 TaxID=2692806 RepID=UPI0016839A2E|nr:TIGR02587 family membrane protein [Leptolyngbya sp. FACHB-261]MBD2100541.1 TIGR02587 family membrane protein [Leptolyngbya sp. FACHB-261]
MPSKKRKQPSAWRRELDDLLRGIAGAFLFGVPLLYTMEVWWKGNFTRPPRLLFVLGLTYVVLLAVNRTTGFRKQQHMTWLRTLTDSAESLAIGLLMAALSLILLRRVTAEVALEATMGRIVLEGIPFGLGVGIANGWLQSDDSENQETDSKDPGSKQEQTNRPKKPGWQQTLADAGATMMGAIIVAFSIAPTDEVPMIASALSPPWLLALIAASLMVSYVIVFQAKFGSQTVRMTQEGILQTPLGETVLSYLLSLLTAVIMLWLFQLLRPGDPLMQWVSYTIVLGFPATIGGAAGRLAI